MLRKPFLRALEYERVVLKQNGFLLLYWKTIRPSYLQIPHINKCIFRNAGVILIPLEAANDVNIKICNTWHKENYIIDLIPTEVNIGKFKEVKPQFKNFKLSVAFESSSVNLVTDTIVVEANETKFLLAQFIFTINEEAINISNQNLINDYSLLPTPERQ